jgi:arabinofuranan 3-O-arabinosyltransferase
LRKGGWRYPAAFAIVVQIVGSVNATALVFALLAPLLWVPYAVWISREVDWKRAALTLLRVGVLTLGASLWWIAGLWAQGSYGIDILKYTETVKTVATAGVAPEVLRGLGYWFFYGGDKLGNWIEASVHYTQSRPLIAASYAVPTLALLAAAFIRWRHRFYFAVLMVVGVAIAVGAHPFGDPSPFGALLKAFADSSNAGLALRSVGRAVPLVALGAAVLLGAGVTALVRWLDRRNLHRYALAVVGVVGAIVIAALPALWNGDYYGNNLQRPENIPNYWTRAIAAVDRQPHDTRVLEVPGSDFASYRWGNTVDPITPGLMDRPYVARELIPYGTPETQRPPGRPLQPGAPEADGAAAQSAPGGDRLADGVRHEPRPAAPLPAPRREGARDPGRYSRPSAGGRVPRRQRAVDRAGPAGQRALGRRRRR